MTTTLSNTLRSTCLAALALPALGSCEDIEKALEESGNRIWVCEKVDAPALRASGSLRVEAGGKKFKVKVDDKAKLELGPLVNRADQPVACGQRQVGSGTFFSLLRHRKGKPAMTLYVMGFDYMDLKPKALTYKLTVSGNVIIPGEDKPHRFSITDSSVEYVGHKRDKIKLDFNNFSSLPGTKFPVSFSGHIEIDLAN